MTALSCIVPLAFRSSCQVQLDFPPMGGVGKLMVCAIVHVQLES